MESMKVAEKAEVEQQKRETEALGEVLECQNIFIGLPSNDKEEVVQELVGFRGCPG